MKRLTARKALLWVLGGIAAAGLVAAFVRSAWQLGEAPPDELVLDDVVDDVDAGQA